MNPHATENSGVGVPGRKKIIKSWVKEKDSSLRRTPGLISETLPPLVCQLGDSCAPILSGWGKTLGGTSTSLSCWDSVLDQIKSRVGEQRFGLWFKNTRFLSFEDGLLKIGVPNRFVQEWLEEHFSKDLSNLAREKFGEDLSLKFVIDGSLFQERRSETIAQQAAFLEEFASSPKEARTPSTLRPDLTLSNFVVGPCNELAYAGAKRVIQSPGEAYNPFFIHGTVGVGKTHLLQGICHAFHEARSDLKAIYFSGEMFTNQFIHSLKTHRLDAFRHRYRDVDVLILDDVQFLANKEHTQQEFLHTFNALDSRNRQIVLASDSHPRMIKKLKETLLSRFVSGMVVRLDLPDYSTRLEILKRKSLARRKRVPPEVLNYISRQTTGSVRDLEGALNILVAYAGLAGGKIDLKLARTALEGLAEKSKPRLGIREIECVVCKHLGVKPEDLKSAKRTRSLYRARQIVIYLARKLTDLSYADIAEYVGRRNHTAAIAAFKKVSASLAKDPALLETLSKLQGDLSGHT